jgi:hypothetical protein
MVYKSVTERHYLRDTTKLAAIQAIQVIKEYFLLAGLILRYVHPLPVDLVVSGDDN